jgi:hypothetical protein
MNDLTVVIVNYRTPDLTISTLASLERDLEPGRVEVVVVDNHSQDDAAGQIGRWIKDNQLDDRIHLIAATHNGGFSAGNNIGIQAIAAENYLLLNSDTLMRPGAIKCLLECTKQYPQAGLISPRLEWTDGKPQQSCFRFHTPISEFIYAAKTGFIASWFANYVVAHPVQPEFGSYDWTSFACVLIRREVLDAIGLLDDSYFMYFEDVDFCRRVQQAGWTVMNVPQAHVVHLRGGSSPLKSRVKLRKRLPRYFYESRTRYFHKWYGRSGLLAANLLWTLGFVISSVREMLSASYRANAAASQWRDIWINFWQPGKPYIHPDDYDKT